jgi:probable phosphoglycerate mutase
MADPSAGHDPAPRPRLWLVRHGETEWAQLGRHTGWTDIPLTEAGRAQAASLAARLARLPFAEVRSSPLSRAAETARLAGFGERVALDDDLREWNYGEYEGLTAAEIRRDRPGWTIWGMGVPGGETAGEVGDRADRVIARARALEGDTLLFAHGHLLRILTARWLGLEATAGALFALSTGAISILGWDRTTPQIFRWNVGDELG